MSARHAIELLDLDRLGEAVALVKELFPDDGDKPSESLRAIFEPHLHPMDWLHGICDRVCWVALLPENGGEPRIAGIVGLYRVVSDSEALYLGWFGVRSSGRGYGVGGQLLAYAIAEASRAGISYLRLETTDEPAMVAANRLYEKHGLIVSRRDERDAVGVWPTVWRELRFGL